MNWFTEPATLASEVELVAKGYTQGLKIADVRKAIAPVLTRAEATRAGDKVQYMGQERDPRGCADLCTASTLTSTVISPTRDQPVRA